MLLGNSHPYPWSILEQNDCYDDDEHWCYISRHIRWAEPNGWWASLDQSPIYRSSRSCSSVWYTVSSRLLLKLISYYTVNTVRFPTISLDWDGHRDSVQRHRYSHRPRSHYCSVSIGLQRRFWLCRPFHPFASSGIEIKHNSFIAQLD